MALPAEFALGAIGRRGKRLGLGWIGGGFMACVMIGIVAARNSFSVTCGIGHDLLRGQSISMSAPFTMGASNGDGVVGTGSGDSWTMAL